MWHCYIYGLRNAPIGQCCVDFAWLAHYNLGMLLRKPLPRVVVTAVLPVATTVLLVMVLGHLMYRSLSRPKPVNGPMNTGWTFTVVAVDGDGVVDLVHEWSGHLTGRLGAAASNSGSEPAMKTAAREEFESHGQHSYVWADTGQATRQLRYYLTPSDLEKTNTQLDNTGPEHFRDVNVEVLDDDPVGKRQTVRIIDRDEDDDVVNVYRVENERVLPVAWSRCRPGRVIGPILMLVSLVIFLISALLWRVLLGRMLQAPPPESAQH